MTMKRVSVGDLMRWSPMSSEFDATDIRKHPTYDEATDTIEVYKSHVDQIELRKAVHNFGVAAAPAIRDITDAMKKFAEEANALTARVAASIERARRGGSA